MASVKLTYNTWRAPRLTRLLQHRGNQLGHAEYGIPAGCGVADIAIKVHAVEQYDYYVALHPLVDFASYIDDSSMGVERADRSSVISLAVEAGKGFLETAAALGATINEKFAVLANARELAEEVATKLGFSADKAVTTATYLGIRLQAETRAKMFKRKAKHRQRLRKLRRYKRALPELKEQRIGKVFRAGARPALTCGVEILGLDNAELLQLRRDYCRQVLKSWWDKALLHLDIAALEWKDTRGCFTYADSDIPELDPGVEAHLVTPEGEDIDAEPEQLAEQLVQGDRLEFAVDGSCSKPSLVTLQRAGWAVVLMNPTADTPVAVMYGAVPRAMPQSSAMAEFLSMALVGQIADSPSTVYADFMAVVKAALKSKQEQLQARSMYSCVQFFGHQMRGYDNIQSVRHVKAHKSGEQYQALSDEDRSPTFVMHPASSQSTFSPDFPACPLQRTQCHRMLRNQSASRPVGEPAGAAPGGFQKPGDWVCPNCGDIVFGRNPSCRKCGNPKPEGTLDVFGNPAVGGGGGPPTKMPGDWLCGACGDHQFARSAA
ncbi:unnamed protein product, partial [Prorocentrum cordatum]